MAKEETKEVDRWDSIEDVIADPTAIKVGCWIKGIGYVLSVQQRRDIETVCKAVREQMTRDGYLGRVQSENTRLRMRIGKLEDLLNGIGEEIVSWQERES